MQFSSSCWRKTNSFVNRMLFTCQQNVIYWNCNNHTGYPFNGKLRLFNLYTNGFNNFIWDMEHSKNSSNMSTNSSCGRTNWGCDAQTEAVDAQNQDVDSYQHRRQEDSQIQSSKLLTNLTQDLLTSSTTAEFMMRAVKEERPDQLFSWSIVQRRIYLTNVW